MAIITIKKNGARSKKEKKVSKPVAPRKTINLKELKQKKQLDRNKVISSSLKTKDMSA